MSYTAAAEGETIRARSYFEAGEQLCWMTPFVVVLRENSATSTVTQAAFTTTRNIQIIFGLIYNICGRNLRERLNIVLFDCIHSPSDESPGFKSVNSQDTCDAATVAPLLATCGQED